MNDHHKMRAFDPKAKKCRYSDEFGTMSQFWFEVETKGWVHIEACIRNPDRNGRLIFEADIMHVADDMPNILIEPIGKKDHDSKDITVGFSWAGNGEVIPIDTGILEGKIIGNFCENPELLLDRRSL